MSTGRIKLFNVFMSSDVVTDLSKVLHSGYVGEGEKVVEFEKAIGKVVNNNKVVAVNSGTSALTIALELAGVGPGTFVISTPMTCLATNEPILKLGASIIWADIEPKTGNISVASVYDILERCSSWPIKAIMCVHWGGYSCDTINLRLLAEKYGVRLIEDAAHAFGGVSDVFGKKIGQSTDLCCFSFQAIKHVTCGDGGAVVCGREEDYERAKLLRWFGLSRTGSLSMRCNQDPVEPGYKMHMNDIAATIGLANIRHLSSVLNSTYLNSNDIDEGLKDCDSVELPEYSRTSTYWLYPVLVDDPKDFIEYTDSCGVECSQVHVRNDKKKMFLNKASYFDLDGVDRFADCQVNLPVGWWLTVSDVQKVIDVVRSY